MTVLLARMHFVEMLQTIPDTESTPPLYYVVAWTWAKVFGDGETGLRSLSTLVGTATVPVTYLAGTTLASRRAGLAAAAVVAVSPLLVYYSQEARSYALVVLLCGLSFAALARALQWPATRTLALWAAASVLAIATHYFAVFVVAAESAWLLRTHRCARVMRAVVVVALGTAAVSLLALEQRGNRLAEFIGRTTSLGERIQVLVKQFLVGAALPADRAIAVIVGLLMLMSLTLLASSSGHAGRRAALVAASVGGAAVVVPAALAVGGLDYLNTRNATAGLVPLAVAATVGLAVGAPRWLGTLGLVAICCVLVSVTLVDAFDPAYQRPDWRGFARDAERGRLPRAIVIAPDHQSWFARAPLQIYMPGARAVDQGLVEELVQFERVNRRSVDHASPQKLALREIIVAGVGWELPSLPRPLPPSFELVERRQRHGYSFVRFRSRRLATIPTAALVAPLSAVLFEPAPSR